MNLHSIVCLKQAPYLRFRDPLLSLENSYLCVGPWSFLTKLNFLARGPTVFCNNKAKARKALIDEGKGA